MCEVVGMHRLSLGAIALSLLCATGCDDDDFVGAYQGAAQRSIQTRSVLGPVAEDGTSTANTTNESSSTSLSLTVRRLDDNHLGVTTEHCELRIEQDPEPNEHNGTIAPEPTCMIPIGDGRESMTVRGSVLFDRDGASMDLRLDGEARRDVNGVVDGYYASWSWSFMGSRVEEE